MKPKIGRYICIGTEDREKELISGLWAEKNEVKTSFVLPLYNT
jgi:hypothetical protein